MRSFVVVALATVFLGACTDDSPTILVHLETDFVAGNALGNSLVFVGQ